MSPSYEQIRYEVEDGIATVTLNRPEQLNSFTVGMCKELLDAFGRADEDDAVRVVIVTGAGRAFCAGADLSSGGGSFDGSSSGRNLDTHRDEGGLVSLKVYESRKPFIAALNGAAVGVGITMTLPMDFRIGVPDSKIGFVFARRGIVPEAASSWFLPRLVGVQKAAEWAYTGRILKSEEALEAGLLGRIVPPDELLPAARALAREIADNTSAVSVALTRQLFWRMLAAPTPRDAHLVDSKCIFWLGQQADVREGVMSFLEKRPPRFSMKPSKDMPPFYPWWKE
ncbi:MAG: enoyl-CoA hydratase [Deltaproteobacteria bacterium]|nr:enoyl-CoA hydratase [Deltaproteobacteria bacterium]